MDGSSRRVLVFAQLKGMLDIIESQLFGTDMPGVSFLRLDGAMTPKARHDVVKRFNSDPTVEVLLLTTSVGGLGLNLTGADTVVFVGKPDKDLYSFKLV